MTIGISDFKNLIPEYEWDFKGAKGSVKQYVFKYPEEGIAGIVEYDQDKKSTTVRMRVKCLDGKRKKFVYEGGSKPHRDVISIHLGFSTSLFRARGQMGAEKSELKTLLITFRQRLRELRGNK